SKTVLVCYLQELRWDDLVRINVVDRKGHHAGGKCCELSHSSISDFGFTILDLVCTRQRPRVHRYGSNNPLLRSRSRAANCTACPQRAECWHLYPDGSYKYLQSPVLFLCRHSSVQWRNAPQQCDC